MSAKAPKQASRWERWHGAVVFYGSALVLAYTAAGVSSPTVRQQFVHALQEMSAPRWTPTSATEQCLTDATGDVLEPSADGSPICEGLSNRARKTQAKPAAQPAGHLCTRCA